MIAIGLAHRAFCPLIHANLREYILFLPQLYCGKVSAVQLLINF